jgi:hypothetical protein
MIPIPILKVPVEMDKWHYPISNNTASLYIRPGTNPSGFAASVIISGVSTSEVSE